MPSKGGLKVSLFSAHLCSNLGAASTLFLICTKMSDRSVGKAGERGLEKRLSDRLRSGNQTPPLSLGSAFTNDQPPDPAGNRTPVSINQDSHHESSSI